MLLKFNFVSMCCLVDMSIFVPLFPICDKVNENYFEKNPNLIIQGSISVASLQRILDLN